MNQKSINYLKARQFGDPSIPFVVKGITLHNTNSDKSAQELYRLLQESKQTNACHYLVDESEVVQVLPLTQNAWHTGKGYDMGNLYTIAIEICRSQSSESTYLRAQDRAIDLTVELLKEYGLGLNDIYFHCDFDRASSCPHRIRELYGSKSTFIERMVKPKWR